MGIKVKNNADMFAERGDPWNGDKKAWKNTRLSPDGSLTLSHAGHVYALTHRGTGDSNDLDTRSLDGDPDFDRFLAGHCIPIGRRLSKERNTVLKSMNEGSKPVSPRSALISARAKLNARQASRLIKVK